MLEKLEVRMNIDWRETKIISTTPNAGQEVEQQGLSFIADGNAMVQLLWKTVWRFLTKRNILLPYDLVITLINIFYPKELKIYVHTKTFTQMFIAAFFIIAKTGKQSNSPSVGEWISTVFPRKWDLAVQSALMRLLEQKLI